MAKTRPLVDKYIERISVIAFEKCQREITDLVRSKHGVYALYKNERLYYVGLAEDLHRRIGQHLRDKHAGRWNAFSLYLVRKADHIHEIEALLLRIANPAGNNRRGRLVQATNLKQRFRSMMRQRQKTELEAILGPRSRSARSDRPPGLPHRSPAAKTPSRRKTDRPLKALCARKPIYATYNGKNHKALVLPDGRIKFRGVIYDTPSAAAAAVRKRPTNGWAFWRVRKHGRLIRISALRDSAPH